MNIIIVLLLVLAPIRMDAARLKCPGVPHVSTIVACRSACGTKFMYDLCIDSMQRGGIDPSPSHTEETTVYAILAGQQTMASYQDTLNYLSTQLQENTSLSGPERDAYGGCLHEIVDATNSMALITVTSLPGCFFGGLANDYKKGIDSLESCRDRMLTPSVTMPPLYSKVVRDRNNAVLAYFLGRLLGI
ncbi:unnamed protein product [Alopecurus aequalis]